MFILHSNIEFQTNVHQLRTLLQFFFIYLLFYLSGLIFQYNRVDMLNEETILIYDFHSMFVLFSKNE